MLIYSIIYHTIYLIINIYIAKRGWQALSYHQKLRIPFLLLFVFISLSFLTGRFLRMFFAEFAYTTFLYNNTYGFYNFFWFAGMFYFLLFVSIIDITRLLDKKFKIYPKTIVDNYGVAKFISFIIVSVSVIVILIFGYLNSRDIKVNEVNLTLPKKSSTITSLNVVMFSDIHMSVRNNEKFLSQIVEKVNSLNADVILIAGDLSDEKGMYLRNENLGHSFSNLKSKYGVYAFTGNHEYLNGVEEIVDHLGKFGIKWIRDTAIFINNQFYIAGREDVAIKEFKKVKRKNFVELLTGVDRNYPVILIDHAPEKLRETAANGIDLQLSGHSHNGQIFPGNILAKYQYEFPYGYKRIENTQIYVSSGVGTWGPQIRYGTDAEIVNLKITFK